MTISAATPYPSRRPADEGPSGLLRRRGVMLVLSSPSGAGKTTITRGILEREPDITLSVSVTTRPRRPGETAGRDYIFVGEQRFREMVDNGELLEHARVFDHFYGTPKKPVEAALQRGQDVLFDIDWQGTQQLSETAPEDLVRVFLLPPSTAELERRLHSRAQDSAETVARRMSKAAAEMSHYPEYDWVIINTDIRRSIEQVRAILTSERLRRQRQVGLAEFINTLSAAPMAGAAQGRTS